MRVFSKIIAVLAAMLMAQHGHIAAAQESHQRPAHKQELDRREPVFVTVPFDPPLGIPIRYKVTRNKVTRSTTNQDQVGPVTQYEEVRFRLNENGNLLMDWEADLTSIMAAEAVRQLGPAAQELSRTRFTVAISSDGSLGDIQNWAEVQAKVGEAMRELWQSYKKAGKDERAIEGADKTLAQMFGSLTPTQAAQLYLRNMHMIFGWGGAELELDESYPFKTEIYAPLLQQNVPVTGFVEISDYVQGEYVDILNEENIDETGMKKLATGLADNFGQNMEEQRRTEMMEEAEQSKSSVRTRYTIRLDLETGLATKLSWRRTAKAEGEQDKTETLEIELEPIP